MSSFARRIRPDVDVERRAACDAEAAGDAPLAFSRLERAHVIGQMSTVQHVRVHWQMLRWGWRHRRLRECAGQLVRLLGAASKTAMGWVPQGNTGGAAVSPFKSMPVPPDLQACIEKARSGQ